MHGPAYVVAAAALAVVAWAYRREIIDKIKRREIVKSQAAPPAPPLKLDENGHIIGSAPRSLGESASPIVPDAYSPVDEKSDRGLRAIYEGSFEPAPVNSTLPAEVKDCRAVPKYNATIPPRLYGTQDVDPIVTGSGYEYRDNQRYVYAGRTALGGKWGLQEYAVDSAPGMTGVDVGPNSLAEYEGSILGYNDGIPEQWAFPSTPMRYYVPKDDDYFGRDGVTVQNTDSLYALYTPDHDPLIGEEEGPGPNPEGENYY